MALTLQRCWIHIRGLHREKVLGAQRDESCPQGAPAVHGGVLGAVRRPAQHGMEHAELLLPVSRCTMLVHRVGADGRCGNMASILEVSPDGRRFFNVFDAAPENEVSSTSAPNEFGLTLIPARRPSTATTRQSDRVLPVDGSPVSIKRSAPRAAASARSLYR